VWRVGLVVDQYYPAGDGRSGVTALCARASRVSSMGRSKVRLAAMRERAVRAPQATPAPRPLSNVAGHPDDLVFQHRGDGAIEPHLPVAYLQAVLKIDRSPRLERALDVAEELVGLLWYEELVYRLAKHFGWRFVEERRVGRCDLEVASFSVENEYDVGHSLEKRPQLTSEARSSSSTRLRSRRSAASFRPRSTVARKRVRLSFMT
jgi:hypothetical protein